MPPPIVRFLIPSIFEKEVDSIAVTLFGITRFSTLVQSNALIPIVFSPSPKLILLILGHSSKV